MKIKVKELVNDKNALGICIMNAISSDEEKLRRVVSKYQSEIDLENHSEWDNTEIPFYMVFGGEKFSLEEFYNSFFNSFNISVEGRAKKLAIEIAEKEMPFLLEEVKQGKREQIRKMIEELEYLESEL